MIEQVIHLTTKSGGLPPVIRAVEGDTGRFLDAYTDDNTVTQFQTAELAVHRPDGSYYSIPASTEYQYGFFYLDLTQALTRAGRVECQLKVSLSTRVISTYTFIIIVEPSTSGLPVEQLGYDIYDLIEAADTIRGSGLTDDIKQALLDCFEHVAWTDEHGQDYVDALEAALYPPANLVSISAVYTQSGTVYDTDTLDSLKEDLVVTAHYDDSSSETVTTYTLSGTLAEGTSTITVSYGGKTTTFTVTVTEYPSYSITYNLTNVTSSNDAVKVSQGGSYTTTLSYDDTQYVLPLPTITMGGVDVTANYYDSASRTLTINNVTGNIVITAAATGLTEITFLECGIANTNGGMKVYSDNEQTQIGNPGVYGYGALRIAPVIFAQDTTIRVTFTNETSSTMNKGNIYLGSLDPFYKANQTQYSNIYAVITTANLEAGASVTREFTVKAGHYPVIEHNVSGTSKYTITALSYGEPKTITTVKEWVCNTRPGTITWYASSDGSGDANTIGNYPYISYAPVPANAGNAVVCVSHRNEETLITADIASGDFSGASGATSSAITAYNWATFNETLRIIGNLPMFMNITKYQGMQKLFRGTNSNTAFNSIKEVTL